MQGIEKMCPHDSWVAGTGLDATINTKNTTSTNNDYFITPYQAAPYFAENPTPNYFTRSMITGSKIKILNSNPAAYIYTVSFYDEKGRMIQTQSSNASGGKDMISNQYDFSGKLLRSLLEHQVNGPNPQAYTILTKMDYDHAGRLLTIKKNIVTSNVNGLASVSSIPDKLIVENSYDELGQLKEKKLGTNPDNGLPLESLNYDYNIRGWLTGVNKAYITGNTNNNYFGFDLGYDKPGALGTYSPQYNGNISGTVWRSKGDGEKRKCDFSYDAANRLTAADFNQYQSGTGTSAIFNKAAGIDFSVSGLSYDANGNILSMNQNGLKGLTSAPIDQLSYNYQPNSNKLQQVTDAVNDNNSKLGDFKYDANTKTTTDYGYDENGNLTQDNNKKISNIAYNYLNLPQLITIPGKGTISYSYDAGGNKLSKETVDNSTAGKTITTTTKYIGGFIYESKTTNPADANAPDYTDKLQFFAHEEGRFRVLNFSITVPACAIELCYVDLEGTFICETSECPPAQSIINFASDYFVKDHLGNTRVVLTDEKQQQVYPAATLEGIATDNSSAIAAESKYYDIKTTNVVPQASAMGIPSYANNNGNPPYNNNPNSNTVANSDKLYRLNANNPTAKMGLGITLKVMAGDEVNIFGKSYWKTASAAENPNIIEALPIVDILSAFVGGNAAATAKGITGEALNNVPGLPTAIQQIQNQQTPGKPKAAINWILFDEQFNPVISSSNSGFSSIGAEGQLTDHRSTGGGILTTGEITKNGYLYVYCSNESKVDVFFDNLQVVHNKGALLEENTYYGFGLGMAGISYRSAGSLENKLQYNGKEKQDKEFSDGSGLDWYDYGARMQDPQLGRFMQIDPKCEVFPHYNPYNYCFNNPLLFVDPDGMLAKYNWDDGKYYDEGKEVSFDQVQQQYQIGQYSPTTSVMVASEFESDGKTVKNDYGTGALGQCHLVSD